MKPKTSLSQLRFPWFSEQSRKKLKSRIRPLPWPPRIGRKIAFKSGFGIQTGILREIRQGLVRRQYTMADGRIAMEHELVMLPASTPWRHPDSVPEQELNECIKRIKVPHDAAPNADPRQNPELWADICQLMAYIALKKAIENEGKRDVLMEFTPTIPPS